MSDNGRTFFPDSRTEALAMLYLQNQDLKDKTPEEIYVMYRDAYERFAKVHRAYRAQNPSVVR